MHLTNCGLHKTLMFWAQMLEPSNSNAERRGRGGRVAKQRDSAWYLLRREHKKQWAGLFQASFNMSEPSLSTLEHKASKARSAGHGEEDRGRFTARVGAGKESFTLTAFALPCLWLSFI